MLLIVIFNWQNWRTEHHNLPVITLWQMEQQEPYLLPINYFFLKLWVLGSFNKCHASLKKKKVKKKE